MTARRWQRPSWFAIALTIAGVALFLRLGIWQLDRMHEKRAMLDAGAAALHERKAVPLADAAWDTARAHAYDWAEGTGAFADRQPVLLDNQVRNGRAGVRVYRVFYMDKADRSMGGAILADLGWLPLAANRELPKLSFPVSDRMEVRGLLAPPPSFGIPLGVGFEHKGDVWLATRIDPAALAPVLLQWVPAWKPALAPRVLRLDPALPLGFERDLEVLPGNMPPERHQGYAVTWFGFALVALVIFVMLHFRRV
jgi:cytochrome oxidase assembly protein ShyY1